MNDIWFEVLKIVVSVCSALITLYVLPYLHRLAENEKMKEVTEMVNTAVSAVEQTTIGERKGGVKKDMVITLVSDWLKKRAINITPDQLDGIIEAAVYGMNAGKGKQ